MKIEDIKGVVVASVTAFTCKREIDEDATRRLIDYYIKGGLKGAFMNSSSGEYFSMTNRQRARCVSVAKEQAKGAIAIFAGISDDVLSQVHENAGIMADAGADILVAMPPRFNNYTDDELYAFFTEIADKSPLPVILYNHMLRLNNKLSIELLIRLSAHPNIWGVKDTHNDASRLMTLLSRLKGNESFAVYAGGDSMAGFSVLMGGYILNALSAINPGLFVRMLSSGKARDVERVMELQQRAGELMQLFGILNQNRGHSMSLFCQSIKAALAAKGLCGTYTAQLGYEITPEELETVRLFLQKNR